MKLSDNDSVISPLL